MGFLRSVVATQPKKEHPMKRRISTISLTVALVATACTGGGADDQALDNPSITPAGRSLQEPAVTTTTVPAPTTTTTTVLAPSTLAFTSSADVGRLFAVRDDVVASTSPGGDPDAATVSAGTIVQVSSLRSSDDTLWVRIESTVAGESTLGWVASDALTPTTESVFTEDAQSAREFRQVSAAVENDQLGLFADPGTGTAIAFLAENEIAMHGGVSALTPSGDVWLDVIDPETSVRIGWVPARSFNGLSGGAIQDDDHNGASRSPEDGVNYGQALAGAVSATGCNAVQVTFTNTSASAGVGMVFGTSAPVGRELSSGGHRWSGTTVFGPAGSDITITVPSTSTTSWFFAPLDDDGQASFSSVNEDGLAVADDVSEISVAVGSCAPIPPDPTAPRLDEYVLDLPEEDRDAAIAQFEADLAEFEGRNAPLIPDLEDGEAGDAGAEAEDGAAGDPAGETDAVDPANLPAAGASPATATDPAATDPAATDPAATDPAASDPAADENAGQPAA